MQSARFLHVLEVALDPDHALLDQPAVGLDLGFAGTAEEAEAAALALQMGPGPHEARFLIIEMGEFDLQHAFGGARAAAEDFEDQAGAVDHLGLEFLLQIALLDRRERAIHHDEVDLVLSDARRQLGGLALADIGRGTELAQRDQHACPTTLRSIARASPTASSRLASGVRADDFSAAAREVE